MKVFTVKNMNEPSKYTVEAFNRRLAQILFNQLGYETCKQIVDYSNEEK